MILIFGKNDVDASTEDVIRWLEYFNKKWIRINGDEMFSQTCYIHSSKLSSNFWKNVHSIWFRRLLKDDLFEDVLSTSSISNVNATRLSYFLRKEIGDYILYQMGNFREKKWLTHPDELYINKLEVLEVAKKCNLVVPTTLITTSKKELIAFKNKFNRIITKCIGNSISLFNEFDSYLLTTKEVTNNFIDSIDRLFFPSLFQELIEKEFEIRTYYIDGDFYSMAIFSQADSQTQIDFRNYNLNNPNRTVPYKLPKLYEAKLKQLMKLLNISNGSLDIIRSIKGEYVFLECNPVGQFGMVSYPCNYYLEEKIAIYLSKHDRKKKIHN